jgi:NADH-quinone oxidoreductase subunit M
MISALLILIPLVAGSASFALRSSDAARRFTLLSALVTLGVAIAALLPAFAASLSLDLPWLPVMGSRFALTMDGMSKMLCLLTAISFPLIFISIYHQNFQSSGAFYGWMLLSQAGLMGVFLSSDALLFYFFWELALIPVYFLCSTWGGERRIAVTLKFFLYTFVGSLLMLAGIIYLSFQQPVGSFAISDITQAALRAPHREWLFWLFFVAFAIKMPVFPLHTWQPDAYDESPAPVTMVMSGIMVKMGIYAVVRWLLPLFPQQGREFADIIIGFSVAGMLYASFIAMQQNNLRRLIAFSSIAHIGLMSAALFTFHAGATQGVLLQMFSHGINVIGLWILADAIEKQTGTRQLSEMGGLARQAPHLAILLVIMGLANVALPLTNAFIGEFMMFNGLFSYNWVMAATAGISIILAAVYTLRMIEKVLYGAPAFPERAVTDLSPNVRWVLVVLVILVLVGGVFPQPLIDLTKDTVEALIKNK